MNALVTIDDSMTNPDEEGGYCIRACGRPMTRVVKGCGYCATCN